MMKPWSEIAGDEPTIPSQTVIAFIDELRGVLTRAVVALRTRLGEDDSIEEIDAVLEEFDRYPDVLPPRSDA